MTLPLIARQRDESWQRICKYLAVVSLLVQASLRLSFFLSLSLFFSPFFLSFSFFLRTKTRSTETGNSNNERRNRIVLRDSRRVCMCVYVFACLSGSGDISWGMVLRWKWRRCVRCCSVLVSSIWKFFHKLVQRGKVFLTDSLEMICVCCWFENFWVEGEN